MTDEEAKVAARARVARVLPLLAAGTRESSAEAPPGARQILGVGYVSGSGGCLVAQLEAPEFFADLALLLGVECAETPEVRADMLLARIG